MSILLRRTSLFFTALLLLALPVSAQAKTSSSAKAYKNLAKAVNKANTEWATLKAPAFAAGGQAGAQVAAGCLPVMTEAGKDPASSGLLAFGPSFSLFIAYGAVWNGGSNAVVGSFRNQSATDFLSLPARVGVKSVYMKGLDAWYRQSWLARGYSMTPAALCAAATEWQAAGFKDAAMPPALESVVALAYGSTNDDYLAIERLSSKLRKSGASKAALVDWSQTYMADEIPGSDPVLKALMPDAEAAVKPAALLRR